MIAPAPSSLPPGVRICPMCGGGISRHAEHSCPPGFRRELPTGAAAPKPITPKVKGSGKARCVLGHGHDSKGEALACPNVYAAAAHVGLTTFRPGRPGIPCFRIAPDDDTGRPCYVSVDWVLVNAAGKVAVVVDYKGAVLMSKRYRGASDWARAKRIIASETGAPVIELKEANDVAALVTAALTEVA